MSIIMNVLQIGRQVSVDSGRGSLPSPTILENQLAIVLEEQGQTIDGDKLKQALANAQQLDKDYSKVYISNPSQIPAQHFNHDDSKIYITNTNQLPAQHINHEYSKIYVTDQNLLPLNGLRYTLGHVQRVPVNEIDHGPDGCHSEVKDSGEGHSEDSTESYLDMKDIKMTVNSDVQSVAFTNQQGKGIEICSRLFCKIAPYILLNCLTIWGRVFICTFHVMEPLMPWPSDRGHDLWPTNVKTLTFAITYEP